MTLIEKLNHIDQAIAIYRQRLRDAEREMESKPFGSQARDDAWAWEIHYQIEIENLEKSYTGVAIGEIEV